MLQRTLAEKVVGPYLAQCLPDVALENDHDEQEQGAEDMLQQPGQGIQRHAARDEIQQGQQPKTGQHRQGTRSPQQLDDLVEQECYQQDVQRVTPFKNHMFQHGPYPWASEKSPSTPWDGVPPCRLPHHGCRAAGAQYKNKRTPAQQTNIPRAAGPGISPRRPRRDHGRPRPA